MIDREMIPKCCQVLRQNYHENSIWAENVDFINNRSTCMIIIPTLFENNYIFHFKNKLQLEQKLNTKEEKITHKSRNPSTIV